MSTAIPFRLVSTSDTALFGQNQHVGKQGPPGYSKNKDPAQCYVETALPLF